MKLHYLEKPNLAPSISFIYGSKRKFVLNEDVEIQLSTGRWITIEKGFETDLMSVPMWLWSVIPPFGDNFIGFLIHDNLWKNRAKEIALFDGNIYEAKKFSEYEMLRWANAHDPNNKRKNLLIHKFLRSPFVMKYYTREIQIPE